MASAQAVKADLYRDGTYRVEADNMIKDAPLKLVDNASIQVDKLLNLRDGFDGDITPAPNRMVADRALRAARIASRDYGLKRAALVPSTDGGIIVAFEQEARYADINFYNDGEIYAGTDNGIDSPDIWQVQPTNDSVAEAIRRICLFVKDNAA